MTDTRSQQMNEGAMAEGMTCYERDETLCEDQMCLRTGCRLRNAALSTGGELADRLWKLATAPTIAPSSVYANICREAALALRSSGDVRAAVIEALTQIDTIAVCVGVVDPRLYKGMLANIADIARAALVAQRIEQGSSKSEVAGSIPAERALAQPATDGVARREWQPIATAPKEEVLLYFPAKVVGAYAQSTLPKMMKVGRASDYPNRIPSHWMPLPAVPGGVA